MGYAVGKLAQCLGIPYVQPVWEFTITNLVVDFKFGKGLHRRSRWDDLNEIFQNAVKKGYQSQESTTLAEPEVAKGTTVARRIKEEASDSGRLEHSGSGRTPNDELSTDDDEISISEMMPDIWRYVDTRDLEVNASGGLVTEKDSGIGMVRESIPLNSFRVHNSINEQYPIRSKTVDTLHVRPPRQLPPSDQQENGQTKREEMYEYSWTGM